MQRGNEEPRIQEYLQAGYPCLFMPTVEPEVAENRVRDALISLDLGDMDVGIWRITTGFMVGSADGKTQPISNTEDLNDVLAVIVDSNQPICAILHNVRFYLENPQILQGLIDAIFAARLKGSHIVLVGPHLSLPSELRSLVTYVDCPLPTRKQIKLAYAELVEAYRADIELPEDAEELGELLEHAASAAVGLDTMGAENAIALSLASTGMIDMPIIQAQKEQEVRKSDVLEFIPIHEDMDNVGGFKDFKAWLKRRQKVFTDEAREYGLPYPKGVLIVGYPGTGKSLAAKACSDYLKLPLLRLDIGKVFKSLVGESESAIRLALQTCEAVSPVVLWISI